MGDVLDVLGVFDVDWPNVLESALLLIVYDVVLGLELLHFVGDLEL